MRDIVTPVRITVLGRPQPAGSKRAFQNKKTGKVQVVDANPTTKPWKQEVANVARWVGPKDPLGGPLTFDATFVLSRPRSHYGTGKNSGNIKDSAPAYPTTRPDTTKLLRAVEDALTGIVWRDDAQVVRQTARKVYGHPERCEIVVDEWPGVT